MRNEIKTHYNGNDKTTYTSYISIGDVYVPDSINATDDMNHIGYVIIGVGGMVCGMVLCALGL